MERIDFYEYKAREEYNQWEEEEYHQVAEEDEEETEESSWTITNLDDADWAIRKIKEAEARKEKREEFIKNQEAKLKRYKKQVEDNFYWETANLKQKLQDFVDAEIAKDKKFKLTTINGSAGYRHSTKWNYKDEEGIIEQLKKSKLDKYIRVKEQINKVELKKNLIILDSGKVATEDGEILEGIEVKKNKTFNIR